MVKRTTYKPKQFNLSGLKGISDKTLQMHFKLYEGYVKAVNELNEKIANVLADGKVDKEEFPAYSELTRRLGFEYNGMVLHEYYFDNLKAGGTGVLVQREMERSRLLLGTSDNAVRGAHRSCRKKSNKEGDIFLSDF